MANESAIIVPVGKAESIVGSLRMQYDKSASLGVPAHITLLYPFRPPDLAEKQIRSLAEFFSAIPAFEFSLNEVRRFPRMAYLHPDQPERFSSIIRRLLEKWPDCQPYSGIFQDIIPHLTVADQVDAQVLDLVQERLFHHLPITCIANKAWLLFSNEIVVKKGMLSVRGTILKSWARDVSYEDLAHSFLLNAVGRLFVWKLAPIRRRRQFSGRQGRWRRLFCGR